MKKVVITGMGIVSPVGNNIKDAWANILAGKSGVRKIESFDVSDLSTQIAGVPQDFDANEIVDPKEQKRMDKFIVYALAAADQAIKDAGDLQCVPERIGVSVGSGIGGLETIYDNCIELANAGPRRISPFFIPKAIINMASGHISIKYGFKGPNVSIVTACATGIHSIGEGARLIQHGDADIMICGGAESAVNRVAMAGFCAMHALSTRNDAPQAASRPWDKGRDGFVIGEGAGVLVIEEYEHAKARGARIYAEIAGYGMSGDAYHITAPAEGGEGGLRTMKAALSDAGITSADVDYINAHGTSTGLGDISEFTAVKTLFGGGKISMSSTKSMTGHLLGAAGAIESIFCALAIRDQTVPPTINLEEPDEFVDGSIDLPVAAQKRKIDVCMNNSFGFGGTNASMALRRV